MDKEIIELYNLKTVKIAGHTCSYYEFDDYPGLTVAPCYLPSFPDFGWYDPSLILKDRYRINLKENDYFAVITAPKEMLLDKPFFETFIIAELKRMLEAEKGNKVTIIKEEYRDLG